MTRATLALRFADLLDDDEGLRLAVAFLESARGTPHPGQLQWHVSATGTVQGPDTSRYHRRSAKKPEKV